VNDQLIEIVELAHSTCSCPVSGIGNKNSYYLYYKVRNLHFLQYLEPYFVLLWSTDHISYIPGLKELSLSLPGASDVSAEAEEEFCYCRNMGILVTLEPLHKVLWGWSYYADQRVSKSRTKVSNLNSHCLENEILT
jgi:hypothetical protein